MEADIPFLEDNLSRARQLIDQKGVGDVLFSEGTYQIEIKEGKTLFWPFLQLDDRGKLLDYFCTCKAAEKNRSCLHLAAAYLKIFNEQIEPLHIRFRDSLWNQLCQIASRRHGYETSAIQKSKQGDYSGQSVTGKKLFYLKALTQEGKKRLESILWDRAKETEETSLKFSNLSAEELLLWKEGRPSHHLRFELSFWADLAKWWMLLQEEGQTYQISFPNDKIFEEPVRLPKWIDICFHDFFEVGFYIAEVNWQKIIPAMIDVKSPLVVHEFSHQQIKSITYDDDAQSFLLEFSKEEYSKKPSLGTEISIETPIIAIGDWIYLPQRGFYPSRKEHLLEESVIKQEKIPQFLSKYPKMIQKYLKNTRIHNGSIPVKYHLYFDKDKQLHVNNYLFEVGDLQGGKSAFFGNWAYIENKGFYLLDNLLFEGVEKVVPPHKISDFINRHRNWLNHFEGFQIHLTSFDPQFVFHLDEQFLRFSSRLEVAEESGEMVEFEEWIYIQGRGFYSKGSQKNGGLLRPGLQVAHQEISRFIHAHREDLEQVRGFFSRTCPLQKVGVSVFLTEEMSILIRPEYSFLPIYQTKKMSIFGDFAYVDGEGFSEIPSEARLPSPYQQEKVIEAVEEAAFISFDLELLKPFAQYIDPRLKKVDLLDLKLSQIKKGDKSKNGEWIVELFYESEIGKVALFELWEALEAKKNHLFSSAGLIFLRQPRFQWLKGMNKKRWLKKGRQLRLTTLEWIRLSIFEQVIPPTGDSKSEKETRHFLRELNNFQTSEPIDLGGLQSSLRPYQEIGVKWLWFLFCRGLSGLLCDEMGLGKTHQAMALLAAAHNAGQEHVHAKYLVVCPTSVIYHWEALLKRFLPTLKVYVFYGASRTLEAFEREYHLLLTSYGTLRSEKKFIAEIRFGIAIFDEIQTAKNTHSQTHKALTLVDAGMKLGLTGTPIENRLLELKALFDIILPSYLPHEHAFRELFVNPIEKNQDLEKKNLLAKLIKPFILRRRKSEVLLELPEKIEEIAYCDLSEEQKDLYKKTFLSQRENLVKELQDASKPSPTVHIFSLLTKLKQICNHPCLFTKRFDHFQKHESGKWDLFIELLNEAKESGQKVVVFSQYLEMLNMIEAYLVEKGIGFAGIRGSTRNRKEQLDRFREDPSCEVFVASLQAAGVGVDLVAASIVIHYDRWWNPAKENQATDRVHRIGQSRGVQVFKMVCKNTIEEHIHRLIEKKMGLMEGIIGFDDQDQIKGLTREELLELLQHLNMDLL